MGHTAEAGEPQNIYNSPYVEFSPDGLAWTTNAGDTDYVWYEEGSRVYTGLSSGLRALNTGEHYYRFSRKGTLPIGYWQVEHRDGVCIHHGYPGEALNGNWHGIPVVYGFCERYYYSGWMAYCADCGETITNMLIYMNRDAAASIDYLDIERDGRQLSYYYLCPWNGNLEQGAGFNRHYCKEVSWNQYQVQYHANAPGNYGGYMKNSTHMYNNAVEYEGQSLTPATHLTRNSYTRIGYEFAGWNTRPDGSGVFYEDGAEILNLTAEEKGIVDLYAQWKPSVSYLEIDPGEGQYQGSSEVTTVAGSYYLDRYEVKESDVTAPSGFTVFFETNGGNALEPITGTQHFVEWIRKPPFYGNFYKDQYFFTAPDQNTDTIRASYMPDPVTLPVPVKEGSSFGGWYYDPEYAEPAGGGGDQIIPGRNMTLYAQWAALVLRANDNYEVNGGRGAVNLSWSQQDNKSKNYLLYQSRDKEHWTQINAANDIGNNRSVDRVFGYRGASERYEIPYTGLYTLTAEGAQGGSYGSFSGGRGGRVLATFWLKKGEWITCVAGGSNGYNGGGSGSVFANGGGCTIVSSDQKGTLLIAGGGGGATSIGNGYEGGSQTGTNGRYLNGESGYAGGGGGYRGGRAGSVIRHYHSAGCYYGPVICGGTIRLEHEEHGCWDDNGDGMCDQGDGPLEGPQDTGHNHQSNRWFCNQCGTEYYEDTDRCSVVTVQKQLVCGYYEGQVISSNPAYGGSSYVNGAYARTYVVQAGVKSGSGSIEIRSQAVGYQEGLTLSGVTASDCAVPGAVAADSVQKEAVWGGRVHLSWTEPEDYGTVYYHRAESYLAESASLLCHSNITRNMLTSGIRGYYCLLDERKDTRVTSANGIFQGTADRTVLLTDRVQYLHVAAVDVAGNVGETSHIQLDMGDVDLQWPVHTRQLSLEEEDHIYRAADGRVYVRSDGKTPFTLCYQAYMDGRARDDYQIDHVVFESTAQGETAQNLLLCGVRPVQEENFAIPIGDLTLTSSGEDLLHSYPLTEAVRKSRCSEIEVLQAFTLLPEADGITVEILPIAGADYHRNTVYSDYNEDREHGLAVTGDGTAPQIYGLEVLEGLALLDRRDGTVTVSCTATDALSGVGEFFLEIHNLDNTVTERYLPDADGVIRLNVTQDRPIFSGDFVVTAYAADHVGNERTVSTRITEFSLESEIERILEPHEPVFQCGESGVLTITTWGYADRVEVEFPEELLELDPDLNHTYVYTDTPAYRHTETLQFMVPLYTPENAVYTITVRAYKGEKGLEEHPALSVVGVSGTVLDDVRTRLR